MRSNPKILKSRATIRLKKMKKSLLFSVFTFITILSFGQVISDVTQSGSGRLTVRDEKNNEIASKYISSDDELSGFSSSIIVVTSSNRRVSVYDQKFNEISSKYISGGERVKNVTGNNIIIKYETGRVVTYDKRFNEISHRYE